MKSLQDVNDSYVENSLSGNITRDFGQDFQNMTDTLPTIGMVIAAITIIYFVSKLGGF